MNHSPLPVVRSAPDGAVLQMNAAARHVFGATSDVFDGASLRGALAEAVRQVAEVRSHLTVEVTLGAAPWTFTVAPAPGDEEVLLYGHDVSDQRKAENELARSGARLRALVASLQAGVLVEDESRRVALTNPEFLAMFGLGGDASALIGADCEAMAEGAKQAFVDPEAFVARVKELLERRAPVRGDELRTVDGRVLERDFVPIDIGAKREGFMWQYRDVTEDRAFRALRSAIPQMALDAVFMIDHEGGFIDFNPAAEEIFGYERGEVLGRSMIELIMPERYREAHRAGLARYLAGGAAKLVGQRFEILAVRSDGSEFPIELAIKRIPGSYPPVFTAFIRDITADKEREQTLHEAKEVAEEASRAKSEFLAVMSHEVRTPLNAILGMTELSMDLATDPDQIDLLNVVQANGELLLSVINDFRDFSQIEAGRLAIRQTAFDPRAVVEMVAEAMAVRAFAKGRELTCRVGPGGPARIDGDPHRVEQVLVNLVGNALKFTKSGEVDLRLVYDDGDGVRDPCFGFTVTDTGVGIPEAQLERIFEPFFQADGSRRFGGTGLGLSICESLVRSMGGSISAASEVEKGSTFGFDVPAHAAEGTESQDPTPLCNAGHALVITPSEAAAESAVDALAWAGCSAEWIGTDEAMDRLAAGWDASDLLLIDAASVGVGERDLLRRVRDSRARPRRVALMVPIGQRLPADIEPGEVPVLRKPVTRDKVRALLEGRALALSRRTALRAQHSRPRPGAGARLLVVEDSRDSREMARRTLEGAGYEVVVAADGRAGLEAALSSDFDLVVTDLEMPELDGFRMTERILAARPEIRIIALTAHAVEGFAERCRDAGMVGYLTKPIGREELVRSVRDILDPPPTVLVVDDAPDNLLVVQKFLESEHLRLCCVSSAEEALSAATDTVFDAVLLDVRLGGASGHDTARELRARPGYTEIPIVAMTGWTGLEVEELSREAGYSHFLEKPLSRDRLVRTLWEVLGVGADASADPGAEVDLVEVVPGDADPVEVDPDMADLVAEYLDARRADVARMNDDLEAGKLESVRAIAHNFVGSGRPFGFDRITEIGRVIETASVAGDAGRVREGIEEVRAYLAGVAWRVRS